LTARPVGWAKLPGNTPLQPGWSSMGRACTGLPPPFLFDLFLQIEMTWSDQKSSHNLGGCPKGLKRRLVTYSAWFAKASS
jgi:hypothetical protein